MSEAQYCKGVINRISKDPLLVNLREKPPKESYVLLYDEIVTNKALQGKTRELYLDGHFAQAVEHAYKVIDNAVKKAVGVQCDARSGSKLMHQAASYESGPLRFNLDAKESDRDEQIGYMNILVGCMLGIRNPRVHDAELEDSETDALHLIAFADYLLGRIDKAYVKKKKLCLATIM